MKTRLWVVITVCLIALAAIGLSMVWKQVDLEGRLERSLLSRLAKLTGAGVELEDFQLGLSCVQLTGLTLEDPARGYSLNVPQARLNISLVDYLLSGFRPTASITEVFLAQPRWHVDLDRWSAIRGESPWKYWQLGQDLPERITVSKGVIILASAKDDRQSQLVALDGWLKGGRDGHFRCAGSWGGPDGQLTISGRLAQGSEEFSITAQLRDADLSALLGPVWPRRYRFQNSRLGLSLRGEGVAGRAGPRWSGQLAIAADTLADESLNVALSGLKAQAHLEEGRLIVDGLQARVAEGQLKARGHIVYPRDPFLSLDLELKGMDMARLFMGSGQRMSKNVPHGRVDLEGTIQGWAESIGFHGRLLAERTELFGQRLTHLRGDVRTMGSQIHLQGLTAQLPWGQVGFEGQLDMSTRPARLVADWRLEEVNLAGLSEDFFIGYVRGTGRVAGRITGPLSGLRLEGGFHLDDLAGRWVPVSEMAGRFQWDGKLVSYRVQSPDGCFVLEGGADRLALNSRHRAVVSLRRIPVDKFFNRGRGPFPVGSIDGRWILSGTASQVRAWGQIEWTAGEDGQGHFQTWSVWRGPRGHPWSLETEVASRDWMVAGLPLNLRLSLSAGPSQIRLHRLEVNEELKAQAMVKGDGPGTLRGQLSCSRLRLGWLGTLLWPSMASKGFEGCVSGGLKLDGPLSNPRCQGELSIVAGRVGRLDDLSLRLPLSLKDKVVRLGATSVNRHGQRLIALEGRLSSQLSLWAWGDGIEARSLAPLLGLDSSELDGSLNFICRASGSSQQPTLSGQLQWIGGRLRKLDFQDLWLDLSSAEGLLRVNRLSIHNGAKRHIWAQGVIPYALLGLPSICSQEEELDLSVGVQGDVLSLLPGLTQSVKAASGQGEASCRLVGGPGSLVVGSGQCRFQGGWLEPSLFIRRLDNLNGWLEVDEETHFVRIKELCGTVAGRRVEVMNVPHGPDSQLEPLELPGLGLSLGVLGLLTAPEGIEASIPGLMDRDQTGQLQMAGRDPDKPMLLAGPLESPSVQATLSLNHLNFTYPPVSASGGPSLDFLRHIRWDLMVVARKDVWYQNDFANLRVRDRQSHLHFAGCAADADLSVSGHAEADRGEIIYLDRSFQLLELALDFRGKERSDLEASDNRPYLSGRFQTTVYAESTGAATDIFLTLYSIDQQTGEKRSWGRWGDFKVEFSSSDPRDDTQEKILAKLGYHGDYSDQARQLLQVTLGPKLEEFFIRPVLDPVERTIKKAFGIDVVRFQPGLTWNLFLAQERPMGSHQTLSRRLLFPGSSLLIGKYITDNCLLSYLGKFHTRTDEYLDERLGIIHRLGLEYRLTGGTILDLQYDYERDLTEGDKEVRISSDKRIQISHHFPF